MRYIAVVLAMVFAFALAACGDGEETQRGSAPVTQAPVQPEPEFSIEDVEAEVAEQIRSEIQTRFDEAGLNASVEVECVGLDVTEYRCIGVGTDHDTGDTLEVPYSVRVNPDTGKFYWEPITTGDSTTAEPFL